MNRRSFLKASLAAGVTASFLAGLEAKEPVRIIRLGVIGLGNRGQSLLSTLLMFPGVEVRALCDVIRTKAVAAASKVEQKTGVRAELYADSESAWKKLISRDDLDGVIIATPWDLHAQMAIACMRAGKYPGVEVPAAVTIQECWDLVHTSEKTGVRCMMLENVCYFEKALALLRMIREGQFGDLLHCEAGYQHDCRSLLFDQSGELTWRGVHHSRLNGNLYPTHPIGPIAQWMNINRGDRFTSLTSMSSPAKGIKEYAREKFGPDHKSASRDYAQGDINTTLIKTARGLTVTLYYNTTTHRPYDLILRVQGVNGIYQGLNNSISLAASKKEDWQPFDPFQAKFEHPLWRALAQQARKAGGHEGAEYLMFYDWLKSVRDRKPAPQDVYDAATWSAILPLSIKSVAKSGAPLEFPDFTQERWKNNPPFPVYGV